MIGDVINVKPEYFATADQLLGGLKQSTAFNNGQKTVVFVAGESGSGKSVTAICLAKALEDVGVQVAILHLDDYFKLPPATNHQKREEDISWVGLHEVKLDLLQQHVDDFKNDKPRVIKPLVHYKANAITEELLDYRGVQVLLVEGTYVFYLQNSDFNIFMSRNYLDTVQQRKSRNREEQSAFVEQVLSIEHDIISPGISKADAIVKRDYSVELITR